MIYYLAFQLSSLADDPKYIGVSRSRLQSQSEFWKTTHPSWLFW